ncbi:MAG: hypothetical protein ACON5H_01295 [Akkermansiaceae bacterium]
MPTPKEVAEPHKELRFTRAGQAQGFFVAGAILLAITVFLALTWLLGHPSLRWWMASLPLIGGIILIRLALHCTRHAYLILTPLGIEVFPLWKPENNLLLLYWTEIVDAEVSEEKQLLQLHRNREKTSGVVVTLKPILKRQQMLLSKAIKGRIAETT